ncbi:hypothetical protein Taro_004766 [Colocasia esculenta]|uniref:Uncharacterized protein n=1 Tax=Colocasia esculenta TaxID=4460 RepID=A0A843TIY9_COLES|nr:hypothetical protein [Colocasia esculenta]
MHPKIVQENAEKYKGYRMGPKWVKDTLIATHKQSKGSEILQSFAKPQGNRLCRPAATVDQGQVELGMRTGVLTTLFHIIILRSPIGQPMVQSNFEIFGYEACYVHRSPLLAVQLLWAYYY